MNKKQYQKEEDEWYYEFFQEIEDAPTPLENELYDIISFLIIMLILPMIVLIICQ